MTKPGTTLPAHLTAKGFELYSTGIARRPKHNDVGHAGHRWEWLARIHSGWVRASSLPHARSLRRNQ